MTNLYMTDRTRYRNRVLRRHRFLLKSVMCDKFSAYKTAARIDIQVEVESVPFEDIAKAPKGESSASIRERVIRARQIQQERFDREYQERVSASAGGQRPVRIHSNSQMNSAMLKRYVTDCLEDGCLEKIREAMKRLSLSARAYDRILKVSRTIADLEASPTINKQHIAEAISYRNLDRSDWAERGI